MAASMVFGVIVSVAACDAGAGREASQRNDWAMACPEMSTLLTGVVRWDEDMVSAGVEGLRDAGDKVADRDVRERVRQAVDAGQGWLDNRALDADDLRPDVIAVSDVAVAFIDECAEREAPLNYHPQPSPPVWPTSSPVPNQG